jgi:hypothetical protein
MIADRLREAEKTYPETWVEEAIGIAVENNVKNGCYWRPFWRLADLGKK